MENKYLMIEVNCDFEMITESSYDINSDTYFVSKNNLEEVFIFGIDKISNAWLVNVELLETDKNFIIKKIDTKKIKLKLN